ncbi:MAG: glycosyltransferase family 2 protein [Terriglobales bacterium]
MTRITDEPTVSVIVVTWNGKKYALECLASLNEQENGLPIEIIVVDNASTDGTPDAISEQFPKVLLVRNNANFGFAKANNIGMSQSRGKYVCLINSDVVVPPGCLERMVGYLENNRNIGLLGPKMMSLDGSIGQSVMRLPTVWNTICSALGLHSILPNSKLVGGFLMEGYPYDRIDDVEVLTGWFWILPRVALQQVGGLDEQFFMYGEDIDWSHRFLKAGWRVVFYPDAEALHYGAASSAEAPTRFYIELRRANLQYFRKHHGRLGSVGYMLATAIHELVRIVGYSVVYCCDEARRSAAAFKMSRSVSCLKWLLRVRPLPQ